MNHNQPSRFRATGLTVLILAVCTVGMRLAWVGSWRVDIDTDPTGPVMLLLRVCVLGLAGWVGACTLIALAASFVRSSRAYEHAIRLLPSLFRSWVERSVAMPVTGAALVGTLLISSPASGAISADVNGQQWPNSQSASQLQDPDAPTLIAGSTSRKAGTPSTRPTATSSSISGHARTGRLPTSAPSMGSASIPASSASAQPTTTTPQVISSTTSTTPASTVSSVSTYASAAPRQLRSGQSDDGHRTPVGTYVVRAGDHFWSIAERQLAAVSPNPTEAAVRRYWITLVEANSSKLTDPSNPDLLLVGTVLSIPPTTQRSNQTQRR